MNAPAQSPVPPPPTGPDHAFQTHRDLPHAPAAVFAALQDPERLARWWGPAGFSNRFEVCDFQPGGRWVFDMVGPDGTVYPNRAVFQHVESARQVVIRHDCAPLFTLTVTLQPLPTGTRVHWLQVFDDAAVARAVAPMVTPANEQNLDRWAAELAASQGR